jgi:uncharacterized membrane protein
MVTPAKFISIVILIAILDLPWLVVSSTFASSMVRKIQGEELKLKVAPAIVVYIALAYLALIPKTALEAFLLGLSVYAVYDFTNLATLANYDWRFAVADSLWGGILFVIVHYVLDQIKGL